MAGLAGCWGWVWQTQMVWPIRELSNPTKGADTIVPGMSPVQLHSDQLSSPEIFFFPFLIFHLFRETFHLGTKSSKSWLILTMALLNGLNLIPSSFLPTFFPSFLPSLLFSSPLTPFLLPSPNPREARRLFLAGEGGPWGLHASRIGVSGKNMGCQESGGQEPPKCAFWSHTKGTGIFFFF